jgi:hypothetical protein
VVLLENTKLLKVEFTDKDGLHKLYSEYGAYTQVTKKFIDDRLKLQVQCVIKAHRILTVIYRQESLYSGGESRRHNLEGLFKLV